MKTKMNSDRQRRIIAYLLVHGQHTKTADPRHPGDFECQCVRLGRLKLRQTLWEHADDLCWRVAGRSEPEPDYFDRGQRNVSIPGSVFAPSYAAWREEKESMWKAEYMCRNGVAA